MRKEEIEKKRKIKHKRAQELNREGRPLIPYEKTKNRRDKNKLNKEQREQFNNK